MRVYAALAYLVGGVPVVACAVAGQGWLAVLAGLFVSVNLGLRNAATARHHRVLRFGLWLNNGLFLLAAGVVAATPAGGWVAAGWRAVPALYAYAGALPAILVLLLWWFRDRLPRAVTRVWGGVGLVLLRDGVLVVLVACVFHPDPVLVPAAAGVAGAQLVPPLVNRVSGTYLAMWTVDARIVGGQPPAARLVLWQVWARDALLDPYRPDDSLLRAFVTRAVDAVAGRRDLPPLLHDDAPDDPEELLRLTGEALDYLRGWLLLQEAAPRKWDLVFDRFAAVEAYAASARAQLAGARGQREEAAAHLARSAALTRERGLPNMAALGDLYAATEIPDGGAAPRIAEDESLSRVIRRIALYAAAADAVDDARAADLYLRAVKLRPRRRDRATLLAEMRRDVGRWRPVWTFRGSCETMRALEGVVAGQAVARVTGLTVPMVLDEANALLSDIQAGQYAYQTGDHERAAAVLGPAADEAERRGLPFPLFNAAHWLARALAAGGDPAAAYASALRAVDGYDLYRGTLLDPDADEDIGGLTVVHGFALTLLLDHPGIEERPAATAFALAEAARARGMRERLGAGLAPPEAKEGPLPNAQALGRGPSFASGPRPAVERLRAAESRYAAALDALPGAEDRILALRMVREWRAEVAAALDGLVAAGGRAAEYARLRRADPLGYDAVRDLLAGTGERVTLFAYHMTDDAEMAVFVARADLAEPAVVRIPREHAEIYRATRDVDWAGDLGALDAALAPFLAPVLDWTRPGDVVCLAPFGAMHAVPLHAMTVGGGPLVDRNPVCVVPSATVLALCAAKRTGRRERLLLLADSRPEAPLPHGRIQAAEIAALFPGDRHDRYEGTGATLAAFDAGLAGADLVHLACHGEFVAGDPLASGVLLAGDARLSAADLMGRRMRADLVTLSACESGVSAHRLGEDLVGLAQAAMYAGTPAVLASLWKVDEISTTLLMTGFYRRLLDGAGKAAALRDAQRETREVTGAAVVAYCEAALDHAAGPDRWLLRRDIADLRFRCRDFAGALALYAELAGSPDAPPGAAEGLLVAQTRCRRAMRRPAPVDYGLRPFAHPYHWAPFVLIGDWR